MLADPLAGVFSRATLEQQIVDFGRRLWSRLRTCDPLTCSPLSTGPLLRYGRDGFLAMLVLHRLFRQLPQPQRGIFVIQEGLGSGHALSPAKAG